jgi:hypothetical protein
MRSLVVVIALLLARAAAAGECSSEVMADAQDARANHPKASDDDFHLCLWWDDLADPARSKIARRLRTACATILTARPNDELCTNIAALLGLDQLGKTDVVAAIGARPLALTDSHSIDFLAATHSPRAAPIVIERWKRNQAIADAKPRDTNLQEDWANWRGAACRALAATGDTAARDFLADQVTHPIDRGVKRAASKAIQAIEARTARGSGSTR